MTEKENAIAEMLQAAIDKMFQKLMINDSKARAITKSIEQEKCTANDGHVYSEVVGVNLSKALLGNLTTEAAQGVITNPNIANSVLIPQMRKRYDQVNNVSQSIQRVLDKAENINIGIIEPEFPEDRAERLTDVIIESASEIEKLKTALNEPVIILITSAYDEFVRQNAELSRKVGLKATITRTAEGKCCEWCANLVGIYEYGKEPDDVYRRHQNCRCSVTFQREKESQNVWTKETWKSSKEEIDRRKKVGTTRTKMTHQERIQAAQTIQNEKYRLSKKKSTRRKRRN